MRVFRISISLISERKVQELKSMMVEALDELSPREGRNQRNDNDDGSGFEFVHNSNNDQSLSLNLHNLVTINRYCARLLEEV